MRYVLGLVCVLSMLIASPSGARAQAEENGTAAEHNGETPEQSSEPTRSWLERSHPEAFVDPTKPASEPALQLGVDSAGLQVTPAAPLTTEELKPQEKKRRMSRKARIVVGVIVPVVVIGVVAGAAVGVSMNSHWGEF